MIYNKTILYQRIVSKYNWNASVMYVFTPGPRKSILTLKIMVSHKIQGGGLRPRPKIQSWRFPTSTRVEVEAFPSRNFPTRSFRVGVFRLRPRPGRSPILRLFIFPTRAEVFPASSRSFPAWVEVGKALSRSLSKAGLRPESPPPAKY